MLRASIAAAGLDPDALPQSDASQMNFGSDRKKPWKDIWGCGQGIAAVTEVVPTAALVERLRREYREALQRLAGLDQFSLKNPGLGRVGVVHHSR